MFFVENPLFTQHGYYSVDGVKTFSKYEAWRLAGGQIEKISFNYNDDLFSSEDWTEEPQESLAELYRARALELRDRYDYIVIMYSGGIDSHTTLHSFVDNGIKVDEVCSFNILKNDPDSAIQKEVIRNVIPDIPQLQILQPGLKFRYIDLSDLIVKQLEDDAYFETLKYAVNGLLNNWGTTARSRNFKKLLSDHISLAESGKKVAYIWGWDKPTILVKNDKPSIIFSDTAVNNSIVQYFNVTLDPTLPFHNMFDIGFFIARDTIPIMKKQAHELLRLMKTMPFFDTRLCPLKYITTNGPYVQHTNGLYFKKKVVDACIYPMSDVSRFLNDKRHASVVLGKKDYWFLKSGTKGSERYLSLISEMVQKEQSALIMNGELPMKFKAFTSKHYHLVK